MITCTCSTLQRLNLANNRVESAAGQRLASVAGTHPSLTSLDLSYNQLEHGGVSALLDAAAANPNLEDVNLHFVPVTSEMKLKIKELTTPSDALRNAEQAEVGKKKKGGRAVCEMERGRGHALLCCVCFVLIPLLFLIFSIFFS